MAREIFVTDGDNVHLISGRLRAPRAAAIAGIIFSGLLICSLWLLRLSVPANPLEAGEWLKSLQHLHLAGSDSLLQRPVVGFHLIGIGQGETPYRGVEGVALA